MNEHSTDDLTWVQRLGACTGNHHESMLAVAEGLVLEMPDIAQRLQQAIANENDKDIERYAHTLKSCFKYLTVGSEVALAEAIEQCGKQNRISEAEQSLNQLQPHVQTWIDRIQKWIDQQ